MATTVLQFFPGWQHTQQGPIERTGTLRIEYDIQRLAHCFTHWCGAAFGDLQAYVRFHPRGELVQGSLVRAVQEHDNPPGMIIAHRPVPLEIPVPDDTTEAEMWFHNFSQTSTRCDAWDSRFGTNYWFDVGGAPPQRPAQPVAYRTGARPRPDIVNVLSYRVAKVNAFPQPANGPRTGTDIQIRLELTVWVSHTVFGANAWIDVHVFDGHDALIRAATLPLAYTGWGPTFRYGFAGTLYQGSKATPGSVSPQPDARKVQWRLYYEIDYQVFTDGFCIRGNWRRTP